MTRIFRLTIAHWHVTRIVFLFAGTVTLMSVSAAFWYALPLLLIIPVFVGIMQMVFALTGFCPLAIFLVKFGVPEK